MKRWLAMPWRHSVLATRSPGVSNASTRLCAEALAGIADPLFPALATARVAPLEETARGMLAAMVAPLESAEERAVLPGWLLPHQCDAVRRARAIMGRFGGVLIADGVGLGKTFIALGLVALERRGGGDAVAIVPAALREEWRRAAALAGIHLTVHSHTDLVRGAPAVLPRCALIIVDEAHAFRNPRTRRYDSLARMAIGRRIALLTATPFNNGPADLASLVHLFAARDRFREFGVADLPLALRSGDGGGSLALGAVTVCRTRRIVEARFPELRGSFPERCHEPPLRYDLDAVYDGRLRELLSALDSMLQSHGVAERGAALMHLGLLRRLESSRAALRRSLLRQRDFLAEVGRADRDGMTLTRAAYRAAVPRGDDDDSQLVLWALLGASGGPAPHPALGAVRGCVEAALAILGTPADGEDQATGGSRHPDAKAAALLALLEGPLKGRKAIVFTEYRDTVMLLHRHLRRRLRVVSVAGTGAWAGATPVSRTEALDAFAPRARRRSVQPLLATDVLIATDVAGEGLNLQDGDVVVNYDLPWNPVRIMQRIGRIDRLGTAHTRISVVHLVPEGGWAELTGVLRRTRAKLVAAEKAPGAEPDPLASLWWLEHGSLTSAQVDEESWRRVAPLEARERWRALAGAGAAAPRRPLVAAAIADDGGPPAALILLALIWPDGRRVMLPYVATAGGLPRRDPELFGAYAERALRAESLPAEPAEFTPLVAAALPDARAALLELSASRHGGVEPGPGRRLALGALHRLAADTAASRADPGSITRAQRLLERDLTAGLDRLAGKLAGADHGIRLAERLVELLSPSLPDGGDPPGGSPRLSLVAALLLAVRCPRS